SACAGAGDVLQLRQVGVGHLARRHSANRLVDGNDIYVLPPEAAGLDGAAVQQQARDVQPGQGHRRAGRGLVAADQADDAIEEVAAATSSMESAMTSRLI